MRMWNVNPLFMCRQHLLGEHVELHMLVGSFKKNISLRGYLDNGLLDPKIVKERHDQIVKEMERRGYNHKSPIDEEVCKSIREQYEDNEYDFDVRRNTSQLLMRCHNCVDQYNEYRKLVGWV